MTNCNIGAALHEAAATRGDALALVTGKNGQYQQWSFRELPSCCCPASARGAARRPGHAHGAALFQLGATVILIDPGMGYKKLLRCIGAVKPAVLIAIPPVQLIARFFRKPFQTVRRRICIGPSLGGLLGAKLAAGEDTDFTAVSTSEDELAAIIFTTGSTGPPKGVQYTHGIFFHQLQLIRDYYGIGPGDIDQPGFPLFGLFATALGAAAVIPDMDPTRPAQVNPAKFIRSIQGFLEKYNIHSAAFVLLFFILILKFQSIML
ncbi:hypothetical protein GCAAIG_02825 [Candidatus Electronema halotolerans]